MVTLSTMAEEVLLLTLENLSTRDLLRIERTCKKIHNVA
jgi:hypothetical protein